MTTAAVELSPESPHVLEERAYLEIIEDYEDNRANEEHHYHEIIQDSEVHDSHEISVEHSYTANAASKTVSIAGVSNMR